jgi:Zn-finger nucleic acid-binding protein
LRGRATVRTLVPMPTSLACPRCASPLQESQSASSHLVAACLACAGVWLDAQTAVAVGKALDAAESAEARDWALRVVSAVERGASVFPNVQSPLALRCPVCQVAMRKARVPGAGFEIDACGAHGTFYDKGELAAAIRVAAAPRRQPVQRVYGPALAAASKSAALGATVGAGVGLGAAYLEPHSLQSAASSMSTLEVVGEVAEVAVDVVDVVEVGSIVVEGGGALLGFLGDLLSGLDF